MTTKTLASSLAALAMFAAQGAVEEPVWPDKPVGDLTTKNAVGFENFAVGTTIGVNMADDGTTDATKAYFLYSGGSDGDQSVVTNHAVGTTFPGCPAYFTGLENNNYLSLSTEGGTLFRSLNVINGSNLGQAEPITATGLFVDTLVQFTPCEEPPAFNDADLNKLAIWLSVTNISEDPLVAQTNICVRAGYLTYDDGAYGRTSATYTLASASAISVQAGEWVRLTVKAIDNIYTASGLSAQPGFQVYINDELAEFAEAVGSADFLTQLETIDATAKTALEAKTILPSMQAAAELTAVGFQGTGAVDDFVVTTDKPGFLAVDFTLFWDSNIVALEAYLNFESQQEPTPESLTIANLNHVFASMTAGQTLDIMTPDAGNTAVASGYEIDWENTVLTNATKAALLSDPEDATSLYGYRFTLTGDGPYSVTLVTKSSTPGPANIDFTLTWAAGLTASYKIGDGAAIAAGASPQVIQVPEGSSVQLILTNADGATKTITVASASSEANAIDASSMAFTWADYLGDAVDGAYTIDDANDLDMLRKGVANTNELSTVGVTFKQTANIDMSSAGAFAGIGTYWSDLDSPTNNIPFFGTYDGDGYKIMNVDLTQRNYAGIFNQVKGGTIRNLTVSNVNCSAFSSEVNGGEFACSIIGHAGGGVTLQNIVAEGTFASAEQPCTHNIAGIVIRLSANALVKDCTNNAALYGCYTKLGGICALTQTGSTPVRFEGCANNGTITALQNTDAKKPGRDGVAGIVAYVALPTVLKDCSNTGAMSSVLATAAIGELVGKNDSDKGILTDEGNNTGVAANKFVGVVGPGTRFKYATADNGVATTTTNLVKDTTYLLENNIPASETPVFTLQASGDYIAFDKSLGYTFAGDVVIADGIVGLQVTSNEVNNVLTFTAEPFGAPTQTVNPDGEALVVEAASEADATNGVTIVITDTAAKNAGQADVVKLVATEVSGNPGHYSVAVAINEDADAFVDPDEAVAVVAGVLSGSAASVSIPADKLTPGLYYSLAVATTVDGTYTEGTRYLADGSNEGLLLPITKPEGTKAFYKVLVNMTNNAE